jgi:methylated-DNA-[protein]-cysteine S-methyltransferase
MLPFSTAVGTCALEWDDAGITRVHFPHARLSHDRHADDPAAIPDHARAAAAAITRLVGPGETTTYGAIARELGDPSAARAVGASLGGNPTPIIVPCHRVLAADGSLHGFSAPGGIVTKRRLLEIELAPGFAQPALFV